MGKRKYTCLNFREYETAAMAEYLEAMAAKGWMLERMIRNGIFCFEQQKPRQLRFCVAVLPDSSEFEGKDRAEARLYREYCEEAGWKFLYGGTLWQIFISEDEAATPIETDLALQLETQKGVSLSPGRWAAALALAGMFLIGLYFLLKEPGKTLASQGTFAVVLLVLGMAVAFPGVMFSYLLWYHRAERMLKRTGKLPPVSLRRVKVRNRISEAACLGVFLFMIFFMGNSTWENIVIWSRSILTVAVCSLVLVFVREHGSGNRRENVIGYTVGVMVVGTIIVTLFSNAMTRLSPGAEPEAVEVYRRLTPFPVGFEELGYEESEIWHKESSWSHLAFYQTETGVETGEGREKNWLHLTYYKSPVPLIISGTRAHYPEDRGNVWKIQKTEIRREDGIRVTRYRYQLKEGNSWVDGNPVQDTYLLSDRNRLFVLSFTKAVEEAELERAMELFAGVEDNAS